MSDEVKQRREEAKHRRDRIREARHKEIDEEIKLLADVKRYVVAAFLAVAVGIFRTEDKVSLYVGIFVCLTLLLLLAVLIIVRYQKIREYRDE